jgi:ferredoxin
MAKIVHYRSKCIGCNICFEMQPEFWRMSKRDGKATLVKSIAKKDVFVMTINERDHQLTHEVKNACPVKVIKIL